MKTIFILLALTLTCSLPTANFSFADERKDSNQEIQLTNEENTEKDKNDEPVRPPHFQGMLENRR